MEKVSNKRLADLLNVKEYDIQWVLFEPHRITVKVLGTVNPRQLTEQDLNRLPV